MLVYNAGIINRLGIRLKSWTSKVQVKNMRVENRWIV